MRFAGEEILPQGCNKESPVRVSSLPVCPTHFRSARSYNRVSQFLKINSIYLFSWACFGGQYMANEPYDAPNPPCLEFLICVNSTHCTVWLGD